MNCIGYTISDAAGNYRSRVEYTDIDEARATLTEGEEIGYVWEDGSVTFDGIPPYKPTESLDARLVREHAAQGCQCARCREYRKTH